MKTKEVRETITSMVDLSSFIFSESSEDGHEFKIQSDWCDVTIWKTDVGHSFFLERFVPDATGDFWDSYTNEGGEITQDTLAYCIDTLRTWDGTP